jgi:hypothetical protein
LRLWWALGLLLEEWEELRRRSVGGQHQRGDADGAAQRSGFQKHARHHFFPHTAIVVGGAE